MQPLTQRQIFGYSIGDLGINLNFQLIGFYLAYFYTDVFGISPGHVTGLFLAARIWDAVNDPIMGYLADHTRTRWGRFRPYVLFGALPLNLVLIACFFTPDLSESGKVVYAYVTYILHGMVFTAVGLPYSSISAVMTQDQQERAVISTYRMFFAVVVACNLMGIAVKPFVGLFANEQRGFAVTAAILASCSTLLLWYAYTKAEERVPLPRESYKLRSILPILFKNDVLMVLALSMFLNTGVWVVHNAVAIYYFKYVIGDGDMVGTYFLYTLPANVLSVLATPWLTRRYGKLRVFMFGSLLVGLLYAARHAVPVGLLGPMFAVSMFATFGQMMCSITQWGMLPDTVEYGQWKTGVRSEGIPFAFFSFMQKFAMAVAGALATWVLSLTGYIANTDQPESAKQGIEWLFNLVPALFSVLCLVSLCFYRLDGKLFDKIKAELAAQKSSGNPA
ncbi:MFS transporter [Myxococcota bacterium]